VLQAARRIFQPGHAVRGPDDRRDDARPRVHAHGEPGPVHVRLEYSQISFTLQTKIR
jgi:hypothetical protein